MLRHSTGVSQATIQCRSKTSMRFDDNRWARVHACLFYLRCGRDSRACRVRLTKYRPMRSTYLSLLGRCPVIVYVSVNGRLRIIIRSGASRRDTADGRRVTRTLSKRGRECNM
ncbi:hypothetical protein EVAR_39791_1 [Eumeta japonica]|uniref:Uncharacterized protein n=1 Tax=Eumeta variegata TaxID=151549 RepID=A0A4C1X6U4_EUMVA|nr:hypothetical protein EVAR_39791_1 [Eumeta japonica]